MAVGSRSTVASPAAARRLGIGMVFQHFSLFEALSVVENIALAMPGKHSTSRHSASSHRPRFGGVRPAARADRPGRGSLGRRAPAHRDRAVPAPGAAPADHGRADRGAHPPGSRSALRHPAPPRRRRLRGALHLPPARGGEAALPRRDDPSASAGSSPDVDPAEESGRLPRPADGRGRRARGEHRGCTRATGR